MTKGIYIYLLLLFSVCVKAIELKEIAISKGIGEQYKTISKLDINLRGINNSQEVLRIVPVAEIHFTPGTPFWQAKCNL